MPDSVAGRKLSPVGNIYLTLSYTVVTEVIRAVAHEIGMTILKVQRRINTVLFNNNGLAPLAVNIVCGNIEILSGGGIGRDHVKCAVIITDGWRKYSCRAESTGKRELTFPREDMTDLLPVHKIIAFKEGHSRKILK